MGKFKGTNEDWRLTNDFSEVTTSRKGILEGSKSICAINQYGRPREEIEANAKVIVQAKNLLEALIDILPFAEEFINKNHPAHRKAIEIIKKATE